MNEGVVWIVDDDRSIRWVLEKALQADGIATQSFANAQQMTESLAQQTPDALISDIRMPGISGLELLEQIQTSHPEVPVIITTAHSDLESAVASYQGGAFEYLPKPFDIDEVVATTRRALQHRAELHAPVEQGVEESKEIIGESPAMQEVFRAIGRLAKSNITVLINGESGTGKELVARALHRHSPRRIQPFIALNMAAIPRDLLESELFGHEKGAFTGATQLRRGRFEQANGGTLFLDEIGDMPADTQTRLLRVLADSEFYRVGGHTPVTVDVRIIAATHQNLEQLVDEHRFREDLYHRLNVIRIHMPRLAERQDDIPRLAHQFLEVAARDLGVEPKSLLPDTREYLSALSWPGNVRQLENTCRWLTVMAPGREIQIADLPPELHRPESAAANDEDWSEQLRAWAATEFAQGKTGVATEALSRFEQVLIDAALKQTRGRRRDASILLGWGRNTLTRKLKDLNSDSLDSDPDRG